MQQNNDLKILGKKIKQLRKKLGWTQAELSYRAKTPQSVISDIENGKRDPQRKRLILLAKVLGVSVNDLIGDAKRQRENNPELDKLLESISVTPEERRFLEQLPGLKADSYSRILEQVRERVEIEKLRHEAEQSSGNE